jgi:hypothetical protein
MASTVGRRDTAPLLALSLVVPDGDDPLLRVVQVGRPAPDAEPALLLGADKAELQALVIDPTSQLHAVPWHCGAVQRRAREEPVHLGLERPERHRLADIGHVERVQPPPFQRPLLQDLKETILAPNLVPGACVV